MDNNLIKEIYIFYSKNDSKITKKVIDEFSRFLINNLKNINAEGICFIIKSCSNNIEFLKKILNSIKEYAVILDDIFSGEISPNFELFELFVKNNYINNPNYFEIEYFESISKIKIF